MLMEHAMRYRRLRAPQADRQALIDPPWAQVGQLLAENRARLAAAARVEIAGVPLARLRAIAQQDLLQAARQYTASYRDLPRDSHALESTNAAPAIVLAGHQPELFHPGVWFKNFALSEIGQRFQAIAINLVIDSDAARPASIFAPTGSAEHPRRARVAFDASLGGQVGELPYEQRAIVDRGLFASFGQRIKQTLGPLVKAPLVEQLWPLAVDRMRAGDSLGAALAKSRHRLEGEWGLHTLELPQSAVCRTPAFHYLAAHLLARLPFVWEHYNGSLAEYRRVHRLRNAAQPLPNLAAEDDWLEAPFWCWSKTNPARRRLFVRASNDQLLLADRAGWEARLDLAPEGNAERAVEQLQALEQQGVKLRSRALLTTLFARLLWGDLFLHGIGGAKYDQVTDRLMAMLFDVEPPEYLTTTATVKLPIARTAFPVGEAAELKRNLRELAFSPERSLAWSEIVEAEDRQRLTAILAEKQRWIAEPKTTQNASTRHFEIRRLTAELQPYVASRRAALVARQAEVAELAQAERVLGSREYAFCLHEAETLRAQLLEFLRATF